MPILTNKKLCITPYCFSPDCNFNMEPNFLLTKKVTITPGCCMIYCPKDRHSKYYYTPIDCKQIIDNYCDGLKLFAHEFGTHLLWQVHKYALMPNRSMGSIPQLNFAEYDHLVDILTNEIRNCYGGYIAGTDIINHMNLIKRMIFSTLNFPNCSNIIFTRFVKNTINQWKPD